MRNCFWHSYHASCAIKMESAALDEILINQHVDSSMIVDSPHLTLDTLFFENSPQEARDQFELRMCFRFPP